MGFSKPAIILQESLLGRAAVEGPYRLLGLVTISASKSGLTLGALFMGFAAIWHLRVNDEFAVKEMLMGLLIGTCAGMIAKVAMIVIGRQIMIYDGVLVLTGETARGASWHLHELTSVRITEGPKEWTTLELDMARLKRRWSIRFVAKCSQAEREAVRQLLGERKRDRSN